METSAQSFRQGWEGMSGILQDARQEPFKQQETQDKASLLSSRAQEQKLAVQKQQQEAAQQMASHAALSKVMEDVDLKSSQDIIDMLQKAVGVTKDPAIKLQLLANKEEEQKKLDESTIRAGKAKEVNQLIDVAVIKEAFTDPTASVSKLRATGLQTGNQALGRLADQIEHNAPIQAPGLQGRTFSSLQPNERTMYLDYLDKQLGPKSEQKAIAETLRIAQQAQEHQRKLEKDAKEAQNKASDIAVKREKIQVTAETADKKIQSKGGTTTPKGTQAKEAKDIVAIEQKQAKLLADAGVVDPGEQDHKIWRASRDKLSPEKRAQYDRYENQKGMIHTGYQLDRGIKTDTSDYSKTNPAVVKTKDDVAKLPKGAHFLNPADGKVYVKE